MKSLYKYIFTILTLFIFASCEHEVELDLDTIEPRLVIDASITDNGPCMVSLSLTQSFYDNDSYEKVSGATIVLTNEYGRTETLEEDPVSPGNYSTEQLFGEVGIEYNLKVIVEGKTYEAKATVPTKVPLQEIHLYEVKAGTKSWFSPSVEFDDPEDENNYYYFILIVNDRVLQSVYLNDDEHRNGKRIHRVLYFDNEANGGDPLDTGDQVVVEMQTLDYGMYKYYQTWQAYAGGNANPQTNFTGGVLGCFKAYNIDWITMIVDPSYIYVENN